MHHQDFFLFFIITFDSSVPSVAGGALLGVAVLLPPCVFESVAFAPEMTC